MTSLLRGAELVEAIFGIWPQFHDAEILSVSLDREGPTISVTLLTAPLQDQSHGQFKVVFLFERVDCVSLESFNYQNVIFRMSLSEIREKPFYSEHEENRLEIGFSAIFGASFSFTCGGGEVVSVTQV